METLNNKIKFQIPTNDDRFAGNDYLMLFGGSPNQLAVFPEDDYLRAQAFIIVFVSKGHAMVDIDGVQYDLQASDMFVGMPNTMLKKTMFSADFECYSIVMIPDYLKDVVPLIENMWEVKFYFSKRPKCTLTPEDANVFIQYYNLILLRLKRKSAHQKKVIDTLMLALIYDLRHVQDEIMNVEPRPFRSGEFLFKKFAETIQSASPKPRSVNFYAERLNVSPKYLSSVCKQIGGETASKIIDRFVIKDIEFLMKHSSKSIKEIANELDFPNLSFFGKYVKRQFGLSPKELREKYRQEMIRA